jgi:hypothetical protein
MTITSSLGCFLKILHALCNPLPNNNIVVIILLQTDFCINCILFYVFCGCKDVSGLSVI